MQKRRVKYDHSLALTATTFKLILSMTTTPTNDNQPLDAFALKLGVDRDTIIHLKPDELDRVFEEHKTPFLERGQIRSLLSKRCLNSNRPILDAFAQLEEYTSSSLSPAERHILYQNFAPQLQLLREGSLPKEEAIWVRKRVRHWLSTSTRAAITEATRYRFDGTFSESGQTKSVLYHVLDTANEIVICAKTYLPEHTRDAQLEKEVSELIHYHFHAPSLVCIYEMVDIGHGRRALMMPLLQRSLSAFFLMHPAPFPTHCVLRCAISLFASIEVLHDPLVDMCFADWKPSNICFPNYVSIDYGSVVKNGTPIVEYTPGYALDADHVAGLRWDLNCVASVLFVLSRGYEHSFKTRESMRSLILAHEPDAISSLILLCLDESETRATLWSSVISVLTRFEHHDIIEWAASMRAQKKIDK